MADLIVQQSLDWLGRRLPPDRRHEKLVIQGMKFTCGGHFLFQFVLWAVPGLERTGVDWAICSK